MRNLKIYYYIFTLVRGVDLARVRKIWDIVFPSEAFNEKKRKWRRQTPLPAVTFLRQAQCPMDVCLKAEMSFVIRVLQNLKVLKGKKTFPSKYLSETCGE